MQPKRKTDKHTFTAAADEYKRCEIRLQGCGKYGNRTFVNADGL